MGFYPTEAGSNPAWSTGKPIVSRENTNQFVLVVERGNVLSTRQHRPVVGRLSCKQPTGVRFFLLAPNLRGVIPLSATTQPQPIPCGESESSAHTGTYPNRQRKLAQT